MLLSPSSSLVMIVQVDYQHFLSHLNLVQFVLDREIGTELRIRVRPIIVNILPAHILLVVKLDFRKYISRQVILRLRFLAYQYQSLINLKMLI